MIEDDFDSEESGEGGAGDAGESDKKERPPTRAEQAPAQAEPREATTGCLSCGASTVGVFCINCGQKNDDLRRSSLVLARDFLQDTFSFDSRMWRTLGLLAAAPGAVPTNYAHGKRSRYTPPVRLFLVVSFLFFLTLALTRTMFVAVEITPKTPEQLAQEAEAIEKVREALAENPDADIAEIAGELDLGGDNVVTFENPDLDCGINYKLQFLIKAKSVKVDQDAWRRCADSIRANANIEAVDEDGVADPAKTQATEELFERVMGGVSRVIEDPAAFNTQINSWLPRIMFIMTPVLALILALFIRGRDALFFDHLVLSLYSHAVGFAFVAAAIIATQLGAPHVALIATLALFIYYIAALKRAYGRGWIKTVYTGLMSGAFYMLILMSAVIFIVIRLVMQG